VKPAREPWRYLRHFLLCFLGALVVAVLATLAGIPQPWIRVLGVLCDGASIAVAYTVVCDLGLRSDSDAPPDP
jgi:hypothetical protein